MLRPPLPQHRGFWHRVTLPFLHRGYTGLAAGLALPRAAGAPAHALSLLRLLLEELVTVHVALHLGGAEQLHPGLGIHAPTLAALPV